MLNPDEEVLAQATIAKATREMHEISERFKTECEDLTVQRLEQSHLDVAAEQDEPLDVEDL